MATTSIWAVKGWLGKVVLYIENPEKTENPQFYRQKDMTDAQTQNLSDVIDYAARSDKTTAALDSEGHKCKNAGTYWEKTSRRKRCRLLIRPSPQKRCGQVLAPCSGPAASS